jgi:hypothetical protein
MRPKPLNFVIASVSDDEEAVADALARSYSGHPSK